jgi:hypothetical protein
MRSPVGRKSTMRERDANSVNPPASAIASRTEVGEAISNRPGCRTSPTTETFGLCTRWTITDTLGLDTKRLSFSARRSRSWIGVKPAAATSSTRGSEIIPSGRTGTVRLKAWLSQTTISITSSAPRRKSERGGVAFGVAVGARGPAASGEQHQEHRT